MGNTPERQNVDVTDEDVETARETLATGRPKRGDKPDADKPATAKRGAKKGTDAPDE